MTPNSCPRLVTLYYNIEDMSSVSLLLTLKFSVLACMMTDCVMTDCMMTDCMMTDCMMAVCMIHSAVNFCGITMSTKIN